MSALTLPDIANQASYRNLPLDWVAMASIAIPVLLHGQQIAAKADAGVSLDDGSARGIHMSRLYLALEKLEHKELTPALLQGVLQCFLETHAGLSNSAYLHVRFELLVKRSALVSHLSGWRSYPVSVLASLKNGVFHVELNIEMTYSSTCPCSAALARQLIQQQFIDDFANKALQHAEVLAWLGGSNGIVATPHSQRSTAQLQVRTHPDSDEFPIIAIIDLAEAALGTAVQTAVKRADEQAFALANGQNLMFCEDAARRLHLALKHHDEIEAFQLCVVHAESLHAHDAVAQSKWNWDQARGLTVPQS